MSIMMNSWKDKGAVRRSKITCQGHRVKKQENCA